MIGEAISFGRFYTETCHDDKSKLIGVYLINNFDEISNYLEKMPNPAEEVRAKYKNLLKDDEYLVESGEGYEFDPNLISKKFDSDYYIAMVYPTINDPDVRSALQKLKNENDPSFDTIAIEKASAYTLILSPLPKDELSEQKIPSEEDQHKHKYNKIETFKFPRDIKGYFIFEYKVFENPAKLANEELSADGLSVPIGMVKNDKSVKQYLKTRMNEFTAVAKITAGKIDNTCVKLYYTDNDHVVHDMKKD